MIRACLLTCLVWIGLGAADAYATWQAGRPQDALADLQVRAETSDAWEAWYDLGLCAAAAEDRGRAAAALVAAHRRAPWRSEPAQALGHLGQSLPDGWIPWLGPIAWPGTGWTGLALALTAGFAIGLACCQRRPRGLLLSLGGLLLLAIAPGAIAAWHDGRLNHAAVAADTRLLDATGRPQALVPAGSVVRILSETPWQGRHLVSIAGSRGYLPTGDLLRW